MAAEGGGMGGIGGALPGGKEGDEGHVAGGAGVLVGGAALADGADGGLHDEGRRGPVREALPEVDALGLRGQRAELGPHGGSGAAGQALGDDACRAVRGRGPVRCLRVRRRGRRRRWSGDSCVPQPLLGVRELLEVLFKDILQVRVGCATSVVTDNFHVLAAGGNTLHGARNVQMSEQMMTATRF